MSESIRALIQVVLTSSAVKRGAKLIKLKEIVNQALEKCDGQGFSVDTVVTYDHVAATQREDTVMIENRDVWWQDKIDGQPKTCQVEWVDAEDPLFMLYTSGSTGVPKGTDLEREREGGRGKKRWKTERLTD